MSPTSIPPPSPPLPHVPPSLSLRIVWFALFCDYCLMTVPIAIFPRLGKSDVMTGTLFSAKAMLQVISSPVVARYIDGYNLEPMILGLGIGERKGGWGFGVKQRTWGGTNTTHARTHPHPPHTPKN